MRKHLHCLSFLGLFTLLSLAVTGQQSDNFAYSITDGQYMQNSWVQLRIINLDNGTYSGALINGMAANQPALDALTKKPYQAEATVNKMGFPEQPAFSSGVAALALDKRNQRLYYTPMFIDQLRYIDLKSMQVYYVNMPFTGKPIKSSDQGNIVTRMVIASDGYGYAMTNDGSQLIRFSTGKKPVITDLGRIADDQSNKEISIHSSCSSYGGDMIADDDGNLYVFSARNHIFKISTSSKVATHLGVVTGLPNGFTINGAAVNRDNQIVVASATHTSSLFIVDPKSWNATPLPVNGTVWHTSDLASDQLLASGKKTQDDVSGQIRSMPLVIGESNKISLYPNPVTDRQFVIRFGQMDAGTYMVEVTDMMGRRVLQQQVVTSGENQSQRIQLPKNAAGSVYMVKVTDPAAKTAFNAKIVVQ